nr:PH domain-containing protein [Ktedonobacteraceae bacterium]
MSSNAPKSNTRVASRKGTRSRRRRWQFFRRRDDKEYRFPGQLQDEVVTKVVRKHPLFLIKPASPLLIALAALVIVIWAGIQQPALQGFWFILGIGVVLLGIIALIWFGWHDLLSWWLETYIITNQRIINSRGVLQPARQVTELNKVTQVGIDQDSPLSMLLNYGTVHVYLAGGDFYIKNVSAPRKVREALQGMTDQIKAKKPPEEKPPPPKDPELAELLEKLAKGKDLPRLPDADEHYPAHDPEKVRGPRRTFGGPLRLTCPVRYTSGEFTVEYIQRSRHVLYRNLALPLLLFIGLPLATVPTALVFPSIWFIVAFIMFILLIVMGLIATNYVDDVFILTNKRIIDIERKLVFLYEARVETEYKNIRDVKVTVSNVLERLLDIGNVYIETPGSSPNIVFSGVDHPFLIQDRIMGIKGYKDKVEAVERENAANKQFNKWFSNVLTTLETRWLNKGAPNLQRMDFWSAVECASEFGLEVVAIGED